MLTLEDLGVLRGVERREGRIVVKLTPTYTGCPATLAIRSPWRRRWRRPASPKPRSRPCSRRRGRPTTSPRRAGASSRSSASLRPARGGGVRALFADETVACPKCGSTAHRQDLRVRLHAPARRCGAARAARSPSTPSSASEPRARCTTSKLSRSSRSSARRPKPISVTLRIPDALREAFRFKPGQHLHRAHHARGRGAAAHLFDLLRAGRGAPAHRHQARGRGTLLELGQRHAASGRHAGGDAADGALRSAARATARRATIVAFAAGAGITPIMAMLKHALAAEPNTSFTLIYGNRTPRIDPVPRGAGGPEGPPPRPLHAAARALAQRGDRARRCSRAGSPARRSRRLRPRCSSRRRWRTSSCAGRAR